MSSQMTLVDSNGVEHTIDGDMLKKFIHNIANPAPQTVSKTVEIGVVTTSQRVVVPNPHGDVDPNKCWVRVEILINGKWGESTYIYAGSGAGGYGAKASMFGKNIVLQTGNVSIQNGPPVQNGSPFDKVDLPTNISSGTVRIVVFYAP